MPQRSDPKIGLLLHLSDINGQKFNARKARKLLGVGRNEMWGLIGELVKEGTVTEPGGKGSQVYVIEGIPLAKPAETPPLTEKEKARTKASAWAKKNREQWGVEPKKKTRKAK